MNSILRQKSLSIFRAALVLFGVTFLLAVGPSLIGHADPGGQDTKAPAGTADMSGKITYCADITLPNGAPNVTITAVGTANQMTSTVDTTGNYLFNDIPTDTYTVTPSKTGAISGINTTDVTRVLQFIADPVTFPLTNCQQRAADTSTNGTINSTDATHILNHIALNPPVATNHTGEWRFCKSPVTAPGGACTSSDIVNLLSDVSNENFDAMLLGEVSGNWTPAGPIQQSAANGGVASSSSNQKSADSKVGPLAPCGAPNIPVSLPVASVGVNLTNFTLPIAVGNTTGESVTGYDIRFTFNTAVVGLQPTPIDSSGTLSSGMSFTTNTTTPGLLIIVGAQGSPLVGSGTLLKINFTRVGALATSTNLTWTKVELNDATNDCIHPSTNNNGSIAIGAAPTAVHLSSFKASGYDNGVHLNWSTGFEAENLGFNIYREVAGKRTLVTPDIIAGSALMTGAATRLEAGQSYGWWDKSAGDPADARYFLEEIDVNGRRTMHGPFGVHRTGGQPPKESQAELLSQLGRGEPRTRQLPLSYERSPEVSALSVASSAVTPRLASMRAVKMAINEEGWYRVTQEELAAAGLDVKSNSRQLQLYVDGVEQPMLVTGERDGGFGAIEFFATGQDSLSTDARVYWLVNGDRSGKRIAVATGDGGGGVTSFPFTIERRDRSIYFSSLRNGDAENFFGQVITSNGVDQTVAVSHIDSASGGAAQVEIALQGAIDLDGSTDHQVRVLLNGAEIGRMNFDGFSRKVQTFDAGNGLLRDGDNVFTLIGEASNRDISLVDYIRVTYPRTYVSDQDSLRVTATGPQTIEGFTNAAIRVFDITDPASVVEVTGAIERRGERYAVGVALPAQGTRTLLALTDARIKRPASISANQASNLRTKKNKAAFVIIARREYFPALQPLKSLRESQGLSVALVDIEDIYDEFSNGERTSQAVKDFLSFAASTWKKKPRFVLFAGHASLDPKNHLGFGDSDLIPTRLIDTELMETAWDDWFADFDGDGLSELSVGRLPFRTPAEAESMVSKVVSYDSSSASSEALFVADSNDGYDFEAASAQLRGLLPSSLKTSQINRGRLDPDTAKAEVMNALNRGQKFVNYLGHGSVNLWKGNLLTNDDALSLTNTRLPLFVMMTCLNGYFHDASLDSLGESLLRSERGGAVAVWTSSGMTSPSSQETANRELYRVLFDHGQKLTLGEAVMRAKAAAQDSDVRRTWILLGDPTMRIR